MASRSLGSTTVSTDTAKIDELLTRGVAEVYPSREALAAALKTGKQLRVYNGIDPTAATLHIGHLASLQKLRQFQELGHEVIMLIGDFTGMIGDPSGKSGTRKQLTREQVNENARRYQEQASAVLSFTGKNAAKIRRNSEWWRQMSAERLLELCGLTTSQRLHERDMFQERLKAGEPISDRELQYPVLQAYDSVAMEVDVEVGGTDQTFNMLMGREFVKKLQGREKFVLTVPLLADASGKKIGKTEGNMVELAAEPEDLFGQAMALPDGVIVSCFQQCTAVPTAKVAEVKQRLEKGENPRDVKMELAEEFVRIRYGSAAAGKARAAFVHLFRERQIPASMPEFHIELKAYGMEHPIDHHVEVSLVAVLVGSGLAKSNSDARRLLESGSIDLLLGDQWVTPREMHWTFEIPKEGCVVKKGKRHFVRVVPSTE